MKKLILSSVLILATSSVFAEDEKFSILDADKDGLLSVEEVKADEILSTSFTKLDVNQDGYLSELEIIVKVD
jgi:Ca2+-binding EF-hand superfamily protein